MHMTVTILAWSVPNILSTYVPKIDEFRPRWTPCLRRPPFISCTNGPRMVIVDIAYMLSKPRAATGAYIGWFGVMRNMQIPEARAVKT
ncbi:hypothetical protein F4818DRAFT_431469 [Hypoxylon cercidicola]|nr:hypothetical protein F4818DRAFT_431469 [Hypoxylon cercidicola]